MKAVKNYSNENLIQEAKNLVAKERQATVELIECLQEVERRMLFAALGYSSLWQFCIQYLGMSEGAAQRRISAMRLGRQVPEVKTAILEGRLSLSNASKLESFFASEKKVGNSKSLEEKREIIHKMENLSQADCEKKLFEISPQFEISQKEILKPISRDKNLLKLVLDSKVVEQLNLLRDRLAHSHPNASYGELIEFLIQDKLKQINKKKMGPDSGDVSPKCDVQGSPAGAGAPFQQEEVILANQDTLNKKVDAAAIVTEVTDLGGQSPLGREAGDQNQGSPAMPSDLRDESGPWWIENQEQGFLGAHTEQSSRWPESGDHHFFASASLLARGIDIETQRQVWRRAEGLCEFCSSDGRRCNSTYALEIDHIISLALGGSNELSNLRLVCRVHNAYLAKEAFGSEWMEQFLPRLRTE